MPIKRTPILSIAGFDPTGGAGILTDAAIFRALGFHPLCVLTSVAAQGASGVAAIQPLPGNFIARELEVISAEFSPAALKIGMVYSPAAVQLIAEFLQKRRIPAVLDPIITASSGGELIQPAAVPLLEERLIPLCQLVTPNADEAGFFLGREIAALPDAESAALELSARWGTAVLLKGGHLPGDPVDFLARDGAVDKFPHPRSAKGVLIRGTGCALSAAIAAGLAQSMALKEAVGFGIKFVGEILQDAYSAGEDPAVNFLPLNDRFVGIPFKPA